MGLKTLHAKIGELTLEKGFLSAALVPAANLRVAPAASVCGRPAAWRRAVRLPPALPNRADVWYDQILLAADLTS